MFFKYINSNRQTSVFTELRWFNSFWFVKLHTSNYMYSGTQRMIELIGIVYSFVFDFAQLKK